MKSKLRSLAMLLAAVFILFAFSACNNSQLTESGSADTGQAAPATASSPVEPSKEPSVPAETESAAPSPAAASPADASQYFESAELEASGEVTVERVSYDLPLCGETETFTFWSILQGGGDSKTDFLFWNQLAEKTNVDVKYIEVGEFVGLEQYNLMIASGELTDVIWEGDLLRGTTSTSLYPGGYDRAIEEDIYLDLTDIIKNDCPNYYSFLQQYPDVERELTTDTGTLYCFAYILNATTAPDMGPFVRQDALEATGYSMPETVEQWYTVWKAMADENLIQIPVRTSQLGVFEVEIADAFGTTGGSAFLIDFDSDEVFYDPLSNNYREYVEYFAHCFSDGIVSKDFISMESTMDVIDKGTIATFATMAQAIANQKQGNYEYTAVPTPYLDAAGTSQPLLSTFQSNVTQFKWGCVSAKTEKIDVITRWMDFLYSDYGIQISNFGFDEGVSYEVLGGKYYLTPEMSERDENQITGIMNYTMKEGPSFFYWDNQYNIMSDKVKGIYDVWMAGGTDKAVYSTLPSVGLSDEENETATAIMADIETYVQQVTLQWMCGEAELSDETWDKFVSTIKTSKIDDVVSAYQSAYERYKLR